MQKSEANAIAGIGTVSEQEKEAPNTPPTANRQPPTGNRQLI
jgi:hypothetical protein